MLTDPSVHEKSEGEQQQIHGHTLLGALIHVGAAWGDQRAQEGSFYLFLCAITREPTKK